MAVQWQQFRRAAEPVDTGLDTLLVSFLIEAPDHAPMQRKHQDISDETPMAHYLNIHDVLNVRRQEALKSKRQGPRTFVLGHTSDVLLGLLLGLRGLLLFLRGPAACIGGVVLALCKSALAPPRPCPGCIVRFLHFLWSCLKILRPEDHTTHHQSSCSSNAATAVTPTCP
jgi:hypothetical protein